MKGRSGMLAGLLMIMIALSIGFQATPAQACDSCGGHGDYYPRYNEGYDCYYHRPYYFHYSVVHHYHYHHCHDYDYGYYGCGDYYRPWWGSHYRSHGCW